MILANPSPASSELSTIKARRSSNAEYSILSLLRVAENRFCGDCNTPLADQTNVAACITHRVWICAQCTMLHLSLLNDCVIKNSTVSQFWSRRDICCMEDAKSNVVINKFYERYVPRWLANDKVNCFSNEDERELWISAKYNSRAFAFPNEQFFAERAAEEKAAAKKKKKEFKSAAVMRDSLPTRLVDFYLVVGKGKLKLDAVFAAPIPSPSTPNRARGNSDPNRGFGGESRRPSAANVLDAASSKKKTPSLLFVPSLQSSYPTLDYYKDFEIPEMVPSMIFPNGIKLQTEDFPPQIFTFLLTMVDSSKVYCTALVFNEIVDPSELSNLQEELQKQGILNGETENVDRAFSPFAHKAVYCPKAILLVSHYPFYHYMSVALSKIYRISLSVSPLPLENFIIQIVHEVPLPPLGKVEVVLQLADSTISLLRPPPNSLPMVDFSYRPLFSLLSVDSILTIFRCIAVEYPICLYSSNVSVLTPICESLVSLMFPFSWQGMYIPVLPKALIEILDAPVPFIIGINKEVLEDIPINRRNEMVMYIDVDKDICFIGPDRILEFNHEAALNEYIPPFPKHDFAKLKARLVQITNNIQRKNDPVFFKNIGRPFRNREHMTPLPASCLLGQGVAQSNSDNLHHPKDGSPSVDIFDNSIRTACTNVNTVGSSHNSNHDSIDYVNFLDPKYNQSKVDHFDAKEIRLVFLRFFVACYIDYQDFLVYAPLEKSGGGSRSAATAAGDKNNPSKKTSSRSSFGGDAKRLGNPLPGEKPVGFDEDAFFVHMHQDPFIIKLTGTQMFDSFIGERIRDSSQPELLIFDESISAKHNRSAVKLRKIETPFIIDTRDAIKSSFTCSGPSTWGISPGKQFTYSKFPSVPGVNMDVIRFPKPLVDAPEKIRKHNPQSQWRDQTNKLIETIHESYRDPVDSPDMNFAEIYRFSTKIAEITSRNEKIVASLISFQKLYRYYRFRTALSSFRGNGNKYQRAYYKAVVKLQSIWRMKGPYKTYQVVVAEMRRLKIACITIQRRYKGLFVRKQISKYKVDIRRRRIEILNLLWHLEHTPMSHRAAVLTHVRNSQHYQMLTKGSSLLTASSNSRPQSSTTSSSITGTEIGSRPQSLAFNNNNNNNSNNNSSSSSGDHNDNICFLSLSVIAAEIYRILCSIDIVNNPNRLFKFKLHLGIKVSYNAMAFSFEESEFYSLLKKMARTAASAATLRSALFLSEWAISKIKSLEELEVIERTKLYQLMKSIEAKSSTLFNKSHLLDEIFTLANLPESSKLRKHVLSESLWRDFDARTSDSDCGFNNSLLIYNRILSLASEEPATKTIVFPPPLPFMSSIELVRQQIITDALFAAARAFIR